MYTTLHFVLIGKGDRKMVGDLFTYLRSSETAHQISRQVLQSFPILYQTEEWAIAYCVEWSVYWSIYGAFDNAFDLKKFCLGQLDPCLYYMNIFKKDADIWIQITATETVI